MKDQPGSFATGIAFILAVIFVLCLPITLLAFNSGLTLFNADKMTSAITDILLESDLAPAALAWYSETRAAERVETGLAVPNENEPDIVQMLAFMDAADWRAIIAEVFTPELVSPWVRTTLDAVYTWLNSQDQYPQVRLDMRDFKTFASGENGQNAALVVLHALPECRQDQIDDFLHRAYLAAQTQKLFEACEMPDPWTTEANVTFVACASPEGLSALYELCTWPDPWTAGKAAEFVECASNVSTGEALYNLCQFPDPWREDQTNDFRKSLGDILTEIPDGLAVTQMAVEGNITALKVAPEELKRDLVNIRTVTRFSLIAPLALLLLIFLLRGRNLKNVGPYIGIPLILGSLLAILMTFIYGPLITGALAGFPLPLIPASVMTGAADALTRLAGTIFQPLLIEAIVILLVGVALAAAAIVAKPDKPQTEKKVEPGK